MAWFKGYPGLVGIVNAVVAAPPRAPQEAPERETYQPAPYVPPPVKPPRKRGISRGLLYAGIGVTAFGLAAAAAVFGSRAATQQPQPTPTATAAAVATSTPLINDWYYTPVAPESTPTKPVPQATPTPQLIIPFITPPPIPTPTRYYPMPEPTETPELTPTAERTPTPKPTPTVTPPQYLTSISNELKELKNFNERPDAIKLADAIENTLGVDGYTELEFKIIKVLKQVAWVAPQNNSAEVINDLILILQSKSYQTKELIVGARTVEVVVLTSDFARAPLYFNLFSSVIPKVEALTNLKYDDSVLIIHSQKSSFGVAYALKSGITLPYPDDPNGTILRRYETTTQKKALEETIAHEFDHLLRATGNIPVWLSEGLANFSSYHALRTRDGIPTMETPFDGYRQNLETNVKGQFGGSIPTIKEYDGTYADFATKQIHPGRVTHLGELLLQDILVQVGPQNMLNIIRELSIKGQEEIIRSESFQSTVLKNTPNELLPKMDVFFQQRFYGS